MDYFAQQLINGLVLGSITQRIVRSMQLDRTFPAFRFASDWHYLFEGEIRSDLPRPDFVVVAATVEHAGTAYLYVGVLRHYAVDRQGELARLHLNSVVRRPIGEDRTPGIHRAVTDVGNILSTGALPPEQVYVKDPSSSRQFGSRLSWCLPRLVSQGWHTA